MFGFLVMWNSPQIEQTKKVWCRKSLKEFERVWKSLKEFESKKSLIAGKFKRVWMIKNLKHKFNFGRVLNRILLLCKSEMKLIKCKKYNSKILVCLPKGIRDLYFVSSKYSNTNLFLGVREKEKVAVMYPTISYEYDLNTFITKTHNIDCIVLDVCELDRKRLLVLKPLNGDKLLFVEQL